MPRQIFWGMTSVLPEQGGIPPHSSAKQAVIVAPVGFICFFLLKKIKFKVRAMSHVTRSVLNLAVLLTLTGSAAQAA